ncbi:MAG: hypothetical protein WCQ20_04050 [Synechococcaceae cyanobacterium ELA739]|jgi:hypothetical protein
MPSPESDFTGLGPFAAEGSANMDICQLVAAAADLCRKPWRHAVIQVAAATEHESGTCLEELDCGFRLEVRNPSGERLLPEDLELEIYRSGQDLNINLGWSDDQRPLLWHGSHPVWMDGVTGERCTRPLDGLPLEALARRLRALLGGSADR